MILDLWLLFDIKSKIMTDDLVPEETGPADAQMLPSCFITAI